MTREQVAALNARRTFYQHDVQSLCDTALSAMADRDRLRESLVDALEGLVWILGGFDRKLSKEECVSALTFHHERIARVRSALASGSADAVVPVPADHSAGEMSAAVKGAGSGGRSAVGGDPPHGTSITLSRARLLALVERAVRAGMDAEGAVRAWGDLPKSPPSIAARVLKEWGQP